MSHRALKEFGNTNTGWSYSDLSDLATNHGGPEPLIEDIYSNGYEDGSRDTYNVGYNDGFSDGKEEIIADFIKVAAPIIIAGAVALGTRVVNSRKKHKKSEEEIDELLKENSELKSKEYLEKIKAESDDNQEKEIMKEGNILKINFRNETEINHDIDENTV